MPIREVHNGQNIIDSRDVIARIRELESEREDLQSAISEAQEALDGFTPEDGAEESNAVDLNNLKDEVRIAKQSLEDWEDGVELAALLSLQDECEGYSDWKHGETLIRESYFETYARQLAEDIGAISGDETWPLNCIDWEQAAKELAQDYTTGDFDGVEYLIHA